MFRSAPVLDPGRPVMVEARTGPPKGAATAVILLALANMCNYMDRTLVSALSQPIQQEFGLDDSQLGLLTGFAFIATYALFGVPIARLADQRSRKLVIAASVAAWSVLTALCGAARSFFELALARMGVGIGEAGLQPASISLISEIFPLERRSFVLGLFNAGAMVGVTAGLTFGGWLGATFGWRWAFGIMAIPGIGLALIIAIVLREPGRPTTGTDAPSPNLRTNISMLLSNRLYVPMALSMALGTFSLYSLIQWMPAFFIRSHGMSLREVGLVFGPIFGTGMMLGMVIGGWIGGRLARRSVAGPLTLCRYSTIALPALLLAALWIDNGAIALTLTGMAAFSCSMFSAPLSAAIAEAVPSSIRASAFALTSLFASIIGVAGGPFLVGALSDEFSDYAGVGSLRLAITVTLPISLLTAYMLFRVERRLRQAA